MEHLELGRDERPVEIDPVTGAQLQHIADPAGTIERHQFLAPMPDGRFLVGQDDLYVVDPATGVEALLASPGGDIRGADLILPRVLGTSFCGPAATNSTGGSASLAVTGDDLSSTNAVWLGCSGLPANSFGFFITSETTDFVANPGGSQGNLCLGGSIGRLSNQIVNSGSAGWVATSLDLTQVPHPHRHGGRDGGDDAPLLLLVPRREPGDDLELRGRAVGDLPVGTQARV